MSKFVYMILFPPGESVTVDGVTIDNWYIAQAAQRMIDEEGPQRTMLALLAFPGFTIQRLRLGEGSE